MMRQKKACGVLVFRRVPELAFLLMRHPTRWDLPKGHVDKGESETECALRELEEETGIRREQLRLFPDFRFETTYLAQYQRFADEWIEKTLVIFAGELTSSVKIVVSEHDDFEWVPWHPPHKIQNETIDPLLRQAERLFETQRFDGELAG